MKPLLFILTVLLFSTCSQQKNSKGNTSPSSQQSKENTKTADVDVSLSSSRTGDIIQTIYQQLVNRNDTLKNIEEEMDKIYTTMEDSTRAFNTYNNKNLSYYDAATDYISRISDTALRLKLQQLVRKSTEDYKSKTMASTSLIATTNTLDTMLKDVHTALKIYVTLPAIEQYQADNLPSAQPIKDAISKANSLVTKMKSVKN